MRHLTEVGEALWVVEARKFLGVKELLPDGTLNPIVRDLFKATHYPMEKVTIKTAWCSAGLCTSFEKAGFRSTRSAAAISWVAWGVECAPTPDCVVYFPPHNPDAGGSGHCALLVGMDGEALHCLGFNQSNMCCIKTYLHVDGCKFRWPDLR